MKSGLAVLFAAAAFVVGAGLARAQDAPRPAVDRSAAGAPKRVLFIGNSLLYYSGGLQSHTHRLGSADSPPLDLDPGYRSVHITGATLDQYPLDFFLTPGILRVKEPFETVVLAGNSLDATTEERREAYRKKVREFDAIIKSHGARTALYWLPAMVKPHPLADTDVLSQNEKLIVPIANELRALIIPVGPAYAESYKRRPDLKLQVYDGNHPTIAGQYLSASVVYATLYGRSPVGNPYNYFGAIDDDTRGFLQRVALDAVEGFFNR